jgi:hypothetical protein
VDATLVAETSSPVSRNLLFSSAWPLRLCSYSAFEGNHDLEFDSLLTSENKAELFRVQKKRKKYQGNHSESSNSDLVYHILPFTSMGVTINCSYNGGPRNLERMRGNILSHSTNSHKIPHDSI